MHRRLVAATVAALLATAVSACDDGVSPPTPTPTPTPGQSFSAAVYLLRGRVIAGYQRTSDVAVTAQNIADQWPDPQMASTVAGQLQQEGYVDGSQAVYDQPAPPPPVLPFAEIRSSAYVFQTTLGAAGFFTAESARQDQDQQGGSVTKLSGAPHDNADDLLAIEEVDPSSPGAPGNRAYLALVRHGRVVIELFGRINQDSTTTAQFLALLQANEATLTALPD